MGADVSYGLSVGNRFVGTPRIGFGTSVTVRQNNEPAGGQDVWHLHTHVIPRYIGDGMHLGVPVRTDDCDRARYADRLRALLR